MSLEKNIALARLFDLYGPLLSKLQIEVMEEYLLKDLTLSEIAENHNISRQAVKDTVSKAEKKLLAFEEKLGFSKKLNGEI